MKRISIVFPDNAVYVDGEGFKVADIAGTIEGVQTLQWIDIAGWIEPPTNIDGTQPPNVLIDRLPEWVAPIIEKWQVAKDAAIAEHAAFLAQEAEREAMAMNTGVDDANNP